MMNNNVLIFFFLLFFSILTSPIQAAIPISQSVISVEANVELDRKPKKKKKKSESLNGILSMSFGIGSFIIFPLLGIPAVIFGIIALTKNEPRKGFSITGLILGGITTLASLAVAGLLIAGVL